MKADIITVTITVFFLGVLVTGVGATEAFQSDNDAPASELHMGITLER